MSITVVLPTRNGREAFLRTALDSIKRQTAFNAIDKIIVSENGTSNVSESICKSFPELNITYVKQEKPLSFIDHIHWLLNQPDSLYTAMLHDDDWWYPSHLENALVELADPKVACYFSNYFFASNEILKNPSFHARSMFTYIKGENENAFRPVHFSLPEIAMMCYVFTPFHMSTMVGKTDMMKKVSADTQRISHDWFADRILFPFMAVHGELVLQSQPLVGIRMHETNLTHEINATERVKANNRGSKFIFDLAMGQGVNINDEWKKAKERLNPMEWSEIVHIHRSHHGKIKDPDFLFDFKDLPGLKGKVKKTIKKILVKF